MGIEIVDLPQKKYKRKSHGIIVESYIPPAFAKNLVPNGKFAQVNFEDGQTLEISAQPYKIVLLEWIDEDGWLFDEELITLRDFMTKYPKYGDAVMQLYKEGTWTDHRESKGEGSRHRKEYGRASKT